ncbi:NAD(P)H-dependent FMN reductase [Mucilaginibacter gossypiicola]|uniref:NAD(P)H-dependent FMN reductase n=1 Tax=Mucilaginibacter gossypiicola TaxID=551995 RepID=A0A1H8UF46_9SPHI|nr:NADPH-dependent FMN reductase [Mucilaginibacter gossypiicola]SEP01513.1 NAD(P)H-dependent FMN reductase [Mucilaginibacter gossypiicola]
MDYKGNILAISGSLRSGSSNHNILRFLGGLTPADINYFIYDKLADIPPFDPGLDHEHPPTAVAELRELIKNVSGIIICTPEYAFGVPGQLKNTLDWMVSSGSLVDKPVALVTASSVGSHAHAALLLILGALSAKVIDGATLLIPFIRSKIDGNGNITDQKTEKMLRDVIDVFLKEI